MTVSRKGNVGMARDDWGGDPAVRATRKMFRAMESAQTDFVEREDLSPFDPRLRPAREVARALFESTFSRAISSGLDLDGPAVASVYLTCLEKAAGGAGICLAKDLRPDKSSSADTGGGT
jgi:hypothetical protein